jgi:hypothetical protein
MISDKKYQIFCWGVPLLLALLPLTTNSYGDAGAFCWVKGDKGADTAWRFLIFYCWLWAGIGYIVWVYWQIQKQFQEITDMDPESSQAAAHKARSVMIQRMKWYESFKC